MPKRKATVSDDSHASSRRKSPRLSKTGNDNTNAQAQAQAQSTIKSSQPDESNNSHNGDKLNTVRIIEIPGDIFAAPPKALLIHACNCEGKWGAGIAKTFHDRYPEAYRIYRDHCLHLTSADLAGTALLIPPVDAEHDHFIGCLFTSRGKGRYKDSPARILANTRPAVEDLLGQVRELRGDGGSSDKVGEMRMCKINSGLFKVPWERTRAVIEEIEVAEDTCITVMERE